MTEAALRAYLLGKLTESEVALVEARLVDDPDLFSQIETAEDDLFDAFARGTLSPDERIEFLKRYGRETARRRFAQAFVRRAASAKVIPFYRRRWVELTLAASLVVVVGTVVLRRDSSTPLTPQTAATSSVDSATAAAPAVITARVPLTLGTSRAAGQPVGVPIDTKATHVDLSIRLNPADRYPVYAIEIRSQANNIIWDNAALSPSSDGGELMLHAIVPSDRLPAGSYEIGVRGGATATSLDDLGFLTIEVSRPK